MPFVHCNRNVRTSISPMIWACPAPAASVGLFAISPPLRRGGCRYDPSRENGSEEDVEAFNDILVKRAQRIANFFLFSVINYGLGLDDHRDIDWRDVLYVEDDDDLVQQVKVILDTLFEEISEYNSEYSGLSKLHEDYNVIEQDIMKISFEGYMFHQESGVILPIESGRGSSLKNAIKFYDEFEMKYEACKQAYIENLYGKDVSKRSIKSATELSNGKIEKVTCEFVYEGEDEPVEFNLYFKK